MIIEILYPEHANLFGDMSNMRYLQACLPDAEFIRTPMTQRSIDRFVGIT